MRTIRGQLQVGSERGRLFMDIVQRLGRKIREIRKALGLTQAQLAERSAVSENFIGSVERGICSPSLTTLERMANALGVTLSELFDFPEEEAAPLRDTEQALKDLFLIARRADAEDIHLIRDIGRMILHTRESKE